jgi:hypothetical protein
MLLKELSYSIVVDHRKTSYVPFIMCKGHCNRGNDTYKKAEVVGPVKKNAIQPSH